MGENAVAHCHLIEFKAEDSTHHRDGRLWQDADGVVFLAGVPIPVSTSRSLVITVDVSSFKQAVFVDASSLDSIKADLQAWARELGVGHERDVWEDAIRILDKVPENERWALILDNADDPTLNLAPFLPKSNNLTVILTSRNRNLGNLSAAYHMELREMNPEEALSTLLNAARREVDLPREELESANTLLRELGFLPVAIVQAGTYCHALSSPFTQYLQLFYSHRTELMKKAEPSSLDNYQRGAYTTLDLSYNALPQAPRDFLHTISCFHHTSIPLVALSTAAKREFKDLEVFLPRPESHKSIVADLKGLLCFGGIWSEMKVREILGTLQSFSLLSTNSANGSLFLHLHPLVQAWLRDMDPFNSSHHQLMACQILTSCCEEDAFQLRQHLLPHVLDVWDRLKDKKMHLNDVMVAGITLQRQGQYQRARRLFEIGLDLVTSTGGLDEMTTVTVSSWIAGASHEEGRLNEAEKLQLEVLEQRGKILGMEHPDTIREAANLASTYWSQGHIRKTSFTRGTREV